MERPPDAVDKMAASICGVGFVREKLIRCWPGFTLRHIYRANCMHQNSEICKEEKPEDIVAPLRIPRGKTDILKALASTVSKDYTAPHYKFHDDPFFIPASNISKRSFALSKESGRKAARWILQQYPEYFVKKSSEPKIEAFTAKPVYDEKCNVTETTLLNVIQKAEVSNAIIIYKNLSSRGVQLNDETTQSLLELLCFTNSSDEPDEDYIEERWTKRTFGTDKKKVWRDDSLAMTIFNKMSVKDNRAYAAMIRGLGKYFQAERAWALYEEMREKNLHVDVNTYNTLIRAAKIMQENSESRWKLVEELLKRMRAEDVSPNLGTLNAILDVISKIGFWRPAKKIAKQTLAEMKNIGIEPSLASYTYLLNIFCRDRGPISTILCEIINYLDGKAIEIRDPQDVFFFVTAMEVCHTHLQDKTLAHRVNNLLNHANNYNLIGDSLKESIYYSHFFKVLCANDDIDNFFEMYNKYVPNVYTPEPSVYFEIMQAIGMSGSYKYIPQIWSDLITFEHSWRENLIEQLLSLLAAATPETGMEEQFSSIALNVKSRVDAQPRDHMRKLQFTGSMLGHILLTCLKAGKFESAWDIMKELTENQSSISGIPSFIVLQSFIKACLKAMDAPKAIACMQYAIEIGYTDALDFGKEINENLELTEHNKLVLQNLMASHLGDKSNNI